MNLKKRNPPVILLSLVINVQCSHVFCGTFRAGILQVCACVVFEAERIFITSIVGESLVGLPQSP